jgi:hypothetical protein
MCFRLTHPMKIALPDSEDINVVVLGEEYRFNSPDSEKPQLMGGVTAFSVFDYDVYAVSIKEEPLDWVPVEEKSFLEKLKGCWSSYC